MIAPSCISCGKAYLECLFYPSDAPDVSKFQLVELFTSCNESGLKDQNLKSFTSSSSPFRVVIAATAFGWMLTVLISGKTVYNVGACASIHSLRSSYLALLKRVESK